MRHLIVSALLILLMPPLYAAQVCNSSMKLVAPDSRYSDNNDGTITDNFTGLMWKQCTEGLSGSGCSTGIATSLTWQGALQIPATLNTTGGFAGYSDWRLPNIKELASLVEESCYRPAININIFPDAISLGYWSSSANADSSSVAWVINFRDGADSAGSYNLRHYYGYARLVRAGQ